MEYSRSSLFLGGGSGVGRGIAKVKPHPHLRA